MIILHRDLNELTFYWHLNTKLFSWAHCIGSNYFFQSWRSTTCCTSQHYLQCRSNTLHLIKTNLKAKGSTEERRNVSKNSRETASYTLHVSKRLLKNTQFNNSFICMRMLKINMSPWSSVEDLTFVLRNISHP